MILRIQSSNPLDFPSERTDKSKWIYLLRKDGKTIYVGETANPKMRFYGHRTKGFTEAVLLPSNQCPFTESELIGKIRPSLNHTHNPDKRLSRECAFRDKKQRVPCKSFSISLDSGLLAEIREVAQREYRSVSSQIRLFLEQHVELYEQTEATE